MVNFGIPSNKRLLLGSNSPRRRELLGMLFSNFTVMESKDVDEVYPDDLPAEKIPVYLSQLKAKAYSRDLGDDDILITADTVVIHGSDILGKPAGEADAARMLRLLSGGPHKVVTGVTVSMGKQQRSFATVTEVYFDKLSDEAIDHYVQQYRPMDKAGAYGIQEWIGAMGISHICGCYYNVMGLPLHDLGKCIFELTAQTTA